MLDDIESKQAQQDVTSNRISNQSVAAYTSVITTINEVDGETEGIDPSALQLKAIKIPYLENSASMGSGFDLLENDVILGSVWISRTWIKHNLPSSIQDASLRFIHGHGESMTPTFSSGDMLLVDTGIKSVDVDGVYVLSAHQQLFIKRVQRRLNGQYEITSDNPSVKTVEVLNGDYPVDVIGRVVWIWNGKKA